MTHSELVDQVPAAPGLLEPGTIQCPFPYLAQLRRDAPVAWVPEEELFVVSRYKDVQSIVGRPEVFSSKHGPGLRRNPPPEVREIMHRGYTVPRTLITNDPPSHKRYRSLVNTVFTPRRVAGLMPSMSQVADELIDEFVQDGRVELVSQFAVGLPLTIIADTLGVPRGMLPTFRRWSDDAIVTNSGNDDLSRQMECAHSLVELQHYFAEQLEERRREPRDDLMTLLIDARLDGVEPLSTEEALGIIWTILVAGNETTTNLISGAVRVLLEHPDQFEDARADPEMLELAIEESLRWTSTAFSNKRVALEDTWVGDVRIPKGSVLLVVYGSANRDETVFDNPEIFDIHRAGVKSHVAFGYGIHFCLGAALGRLEAKVALDHLFRRLPGIRLADENPFEYLPDIVTRGLKQLNLKFDPPRTNS